MTNEQKILKLAELVRITPIDRDDGYCWHRGRIFTSDEDGLPDKLWSPLTSYDAILPLIQKQSDEIQGKFLEETFELYRDRYAHLEHASVLLLTPLEMADALLYATGKWEE